MPDLAVLPPFDFHFTAVALPLPPFQNSLLSSCTKPDKGDPHAIDNRQSILNTFSSSDVGNGTRRYGARREQRGLAVRGDLAGEGDAPQLPDGQSARSSTVFLRADIRAGWNAGGRYD